MLPKTHTPHHHPRPSTSRGASPSLLVFTMLLGFSSGILAGFLYQQHRQVRVRPPLRALAAVSSGAPSVPRALRCAAAGARRLPVPRRARNPSRRRLGPARHCSRMVRGRGPCRGRGMRACLCAFEQRSTPIRPAARRAPRTPPARVRRRPAGGLANPWRRGGGGAGGCTGAGPCRASGARGWALPRPARAAGQPPCRFNDFSDAGVQQ